jgi:hypothetical protein
MKSILRRLCLLAPVACLLVTGCAGTNIESDLVLDADGRAVIELHSSTETIELFNESDASVRVRVRDKKENVLSDLPLGAQDRVRLDLAKARAIEFDNQGTTRAKVRWILSNDDPIEYSLAMNPEDR